MIRKKRNIHLLIALALASALLATGCSGKTPAPEATGGSAAATAAATTEASAEATPEAKSAYQAEVEKGDLNLIIYMIGEGPADQQLAVDAINLKMKTDIKATLEVKNTPWADWNTKYQLLFNSGEEFDGCFATSWADYGGLAKKGAFYELNEEMLSAFMPNFAPQLFDEAHKYLWETSAVDGKRYLIPQIYDWMNNYVAIIRGDLREKYGIPEVKTLDDILNYALTIGTNEPGLIPVNAMGTEDKFYNAFASSMAWNSMGAGMVYDTRKDDGKVMNLLDSPELIAFLKKARALQEAGAISKSVLSSQTDTATNFKAGKSAINIDGLGGPVNIYNEVMMNNPEFKPEIIDFAGDTPKVAPSPFNGGMAVSAFSKNPTRTLMALDLLMGVEDYNNLFGMGVPGTHWNPVGDDKYELLEAGQKNFVPYSGCPWGLNTNFMRVDKITPDWVGELRQEWTSQIKQTKMDGFKYDDTNFKTETANIQAIYAAEWPALYFGMYAETDAKIAEFREKLVTAGFDKVLADIQAQFDAYIAGK